MTCWCQYWLSSSTWSQWPTTTRSRLSHFLVKAYVCFLEMTLLCDTAGTDKILMDISHNAVPLWQQSFLSQEQLLTKETERKQGSPNKYFRPKFITCCRNTLGNTGFPQWPDKQSPRNVPHVMSTYHICSVSVLLQDLLTLCLPGTVLTILGTSKTAIKIKVVGHLYSEKC